MSKTDQAPKPRESEISIDASQLRPGVHVRLPTSWLEHGFIFNSFVIKSEEQAREIAAMNLPHLFCDVNRSKVPPLPKQQVPAPTNQSGDDEQAQLATLKAKMISEKRERAMVMAKMRKRLDKAQDNYIDAARSVGSAFKSFASEPKETIRQASDISERSSAALFADTDSAIVLITEKGHNDGHASHALSVMTLALLLGKQAGLPEEALRAIGIGALLHDIGKIAFHASILRNPKRNKFEEAVYRTHCRVGYEKAVEAGGLSQAMLDIILHHHERINGGGFPDQLRGEEITFASRLVAIADRFDNVTNPIDCYSALSPSEALSMMWGKEKMLFDNKLLQLFVRAMGVFPPGSIVQLSDNRIGAVIASATAEMPLSPQVMVYEPGIPRSQALIIDLAKESSVKIERPLRLSERPDEELNYLLPRRKISWFFIEGQG
ncbi:MAG: DUF3391 domain-containing protein [Methylovulum sp.]|nr:DUF3391 domain-containing protein [Methylovulum sp.]